MTDPIPVVEISGGPRDMGRARGEQIRTHVHARVERILLLGTKRSDQAKRESTAAQAEAALSQRHPELLEEMHGIAEGADVPFAQYRLAVLGRGGGPQTTDCSAFVVRTADSTRAAKNNDLFRPDWELGDLVVVRARPRDGIRYIAVSDVPEAPGGIDGMSEALIAVGAGVTITDGTSQTAAAPVYFDVVAALASSRSVTDAVESLTKRLPSSSGRNLVLADRSQTVRIELSGQATKVLPRNQEEEWFAIATNHFRVSEMRSRGEAAERHSERRLATIRHHLLTDAKLDLVKVLSDHTFGKTADSVCRHADFWRTYAAMTFDLEAGIARVARGNACDGVFQEISL